MDVLIRETSRFQPGRHGLRCLVRVAHGCSSVDLDELLIDLAGEVLLRIEGV
jgi:hypothetical protein